MELAKKKGKEFNVKSRNFNVDVAKYTFLTCEFAPRVRPFCTLKTLPHWNSSTDDEVQKGSNLDEQKKNEKCVTVLKFNFPQLLCTVHLYADINY